MGGRRASGGGRGQRDRGGDPGGGGGREDHGVQGEREDHVRGRDQPLSRTISGAPVFRAGAFRVRYSPQAFRRNPPASSSSRSASPRLTSRRRMTSAVLT